MTEGSTFEEEWKERMREAEEMSKVVRDGHRVVQ